MFDPLVEDTLILRLETLIARILSMELVPRAAVILKSTLKHPGARPLAQPEVHLCFGMVTQRNCRPLCRSKSLEFGSDILEEQ